MDHDRIEIVALVGSVRQQSYNRGLLRTAMLLAPDNVRIIEAPINTLPFYNPDHAAAEHLPTVQDFRTALRRADAVLVCTPEYGYSVPGVLKNALDWVTVPRGRSVLRGKPTASPGRRSIASARSARSSTCARSSSRWVPSCCPSRRSM